MSKVTKFSTIKHYTVIFLWLAIIILSISARSAITEDVASSTDIIETDLDSAVGSELYMDRFNINETDITHIIILQLPKGESFFDNRWRNYTLFLVQYLNDTLFNEGYDTYLTESILHLQGLDEYGKKLVSDDETTTLVNVIGSGTQIGEDDQVLEKHVHMLKNLIGKGNVTDGVYSKAEEKIPQMYFDVFMPKKAESMKIDYKLTGNAANFVDILEVADESFKDSEFLAIVVAIIILSLVFKSPLGIVIPMVAMAASLLPTYYITSLLGKAGVFAISDFLPAIIGMIGIAVAVDYNLFSLVRFREEYRKRKARLLNQNNWTKQTRRETQEEAAVRTNRTTGQAVMYSGFTVIIGFSALLLLGSDFTLGMAISVSIVVAISIITARTLTPAILALFGDILDWPNFMSGAAKEIKELRGSSSHKKTIWERWSVTVLRKPITFLFIGLLTMVPFIITSADLDLSFDFVKTLPPDAQSRQGFEILQEKFDFGSINPIQVVIDLGEDTDFFSASYEDNARSMMNAMGELANWSLEYNEIRQKDGTLMEYDSISTFNMIPEGNEGVQILDYDTIDLMFNMSQVPLVPYMDFSDLNNPTFYFNQTTGLPIVNMTVPGFNISNPLTWVPFMVDNPAYAQALQIIDYMGDYINMKHGNNTILLELTSPLDPGSAAAWEMVAILRDKIDKIFSGEDYKKIYVTGLSAIFYDGSEDMYKNVPMMLVVAIIAIFFALMFLFRSIVLPIKAILTISGSILFGLGTLVFIFQFGWLPEVNIAGKTLWTSEIVGVTYFLPTFLFTTILGLGMDYSILIISRIKEEYDKTGDMDKSVGIGISKTAGVITSAATIMIATFLVFGGSDMLILKMLGVAMAVAIAVDATISRVLLLPAAMKLLGEKNWWLPRWLDKILPKIELEH